MPVMCPRSFTRSTQSDNTGTIQTKVQVGVGGGAVRHWGGEEHGYGGEAAGAQHHLDNPS
jgi:hypothetical protein